MNKKLKTARKSTRNHNKKETICRLCARKGKNHKDVLHRERSEILKIIEKLFGLKITNNDELHYMCAQCENVLSDLNKFCKEIEKAQKYFNPSKVKDENSTLAGSNNSILEDIKLEEPEEHSFVVKNEPIEEYDHQLTFNSSNLVFNPNDVEDSVDNHSSANVSENEEQQEKDHQKSVKLKTKWKDRDKIIDDFFDFTCTRCSWKSSGWKSYKQHISQVHPGTQSSTVACCDIELPLERKPLLVHVEFHTNPDKLQCKWCGKQFVNIDSKRVHEWRHKTTHERGTKRDGSQKMPCTECGKILADKFSHSKHMQLHMSIEEREKLKVQCDLCKKFFRDKNAVAIHIRDMHIPKEESIACDKCAKVFNSTRTFYTHYRTNHMIVHQVVCPDCGVEMKAHNLRKHKKLKHDHQAQTCSICSKEFRNRASLMIHCRRIHIEPRFSCEVCGKMFKVKDKWKEHREAHFISDRFSCDQCDYVNNDYANMLKHRKVKHADVPPLAPGTGRKVFEAR